MPDIVKKKNGRPKTYTPDVIERHAEGILKWFGNKKETWLKDYCIKHRFPSEHLSEWAKENDKFRKALKMCKDIQESRLYHFGRKSRNATMYIFALKNVAGWRNETEYPEVPKGKRLIIEDSV